MALTPETQKLLMELLKVKQPESIAAPLSTYEAIQADRGLLSTDPVIANLQKVGRGVKSLLEPETPLDYLTMALPVGKIAKGASNLTNKKLTKPLSEREFYKKYDMHHDLRGSSDSYSKSNSKKLKNKILKEGIKSGWVNSAYAGLKGKPTYFDKKFGTQKGQTTYLVPKSNVDKDGIKIVKPYKISEEEILNFDYDFQPAYEAYLKNFNK